MEKFIISNILNIIDFHPALVLVCHFGHPLWNYGYSEVSFMLTVYRRYSMSVCQSLTLWEKWDLLSLKILKIELRNFSFSHSYQHGEYLGLLHLLRQDIYVSKNKAKEILLDFIQKASLHFGYDNIEVFLKK